MFVMFQTDISRSVHLTFFITVLAIAIQKCCCAGSLVTTPPAVDGVLTSCGETRLTCSHDNVGGTITGWRITAMDSSTQCTLIIPHTSPNPDSRCDEFSFEDITAFPGNGNVSYLNSTAVVNPLPLDLRWSVSQVETFYLHQLAVSHSVLLVSSYM